MSTIQEDTKRVLTIAYDWDNNGMMEHGHEDTDGEVIERVRAFLESRRWIPCSERMPELGECVLTWDATRGLVRSDKRVLSYNGSVWYWSGGPLEVTHWQPLPEGAEVGK